MVEGNRGNIKVTTPEDLYVFRAMLEYRETRQALDFLRAMLRIICENRRILKP